MKFPDQRTLNVLLTVVCFALVLAFLYVARTIIIVFAFSILFAYLINPVVRFLQCHSLFFKNLKGPHVVEAYLAFLILMALVGHMVAPELHRHPDRFLQKIPAFAESVSSGEIVDDLGTNFGWTEVQAVRMKAFLQSHRSEIRTFVEQEERFASTAIGGILVIPILAIFFLSDGQSMANQLVRLVSRQGNYEAVRSLLVPADRAIEGYLVSKKECASRVSSGPLLRQTHGICFFDSSAASPFRTTCNTLILNWLSRFAIVGITGACKGRESGAFTQKVLCTVK